ncbi:MAG: TonB-dependent receptor [Ignavibacteria bacterium]|jgi:outer membrane receptor protein involved in Fe transport
MKNIILVIFVFVLSISNLLFSQDNLKKEKFKGSEKKGKIFGKVSDNDTKTLIESATVQLFTQRDSSLITGASTSKTGEFVLDNIGFGKYKLKVSFIGYNNTMVNNISLNSDTPEINVGTLFLIAGDEMTTKEIEVEAEALAFENQLDKKVFNVEKTIVSESGSAVDVLKNVPSVTVDADGNVSLRGSSNVKILINGRPSAMLGNDPSAVLEQIPSKMIESIEIMTNPSSKYDPESTAGIINIVLKRQQDDGYNGNISTNVGTGDKYNTSVNLNLRKDKFNFSLSYNYRLFNMRGNGATNKQTFFNDSIYINNSTSNSHMKMNGHFGSFGMDYNLDKKNLFSLAANYNYRDRSRDEEQFYHNFNGQNITTLMYTNKSNEDETGKGLDINLSHRLKFDRKKEELNTVFQYSRSSEDESNNLNQLDYSTGIPFLNQKDNTTYTLDNFYGQSDYYRPLGEDNKSKFEAGVKGVYRSINSNYSSNYFDFTSQSWIYNSLTSNDFTYKDQVYSVYSNYGNKYKNFGYQVGLRLEQTFTKSQQLTTHEDFENNYFSFFPSIYLTQTITKTNEIQLSYSRRINRPNLHIINPFIDYSDPQNLRKGNPNLKPEYVNAFELGYMKYFTSVNLSGSVFYRRVDDVINRIESLIDSNTTLSTFENMANSQSYGLELVTSGNLAKWWTLNGSLSYFNTKVSGTSSIGTALDNSSNTWAGKLMMNFSFPDLFDIQFGYNYSGKRVTATGSMDPMQSLDIAVKKDFFFKKLSLTLRISDALNTQKFAMQYTSDEINTLSVRRRDSRNIFLTVSYRFGTDQQKQERKQRIQENNNNEENGEEY